MNSGCPAALDRLQDFCFMAIKAANREPCTPPRSTLILTPAFVVYTELGIDPIFPGKHIFNIHNKKDTFTVEGVNADLRHSIPTLARRGRCFPRKLENLQAVLAVFVQAYNRFGSQKMLFCSLHHSSSVPFSLFDFF